MRNLLRLLAFTFFLLAAFEHIAEVLGLHFTTSFTSAFAIGILGIGLGTMVIVITKRNQTEAGSASIPKVMQSILIGLIIYITLLAVVDNVRHGSLKPEVKDGKYVLVKLPPRRTNGPRTVIAEISRTEFLKREKAESILRTGIFAVLLFGMVVFLSSKEE